MTEHTEQALLADYLRKRGVPFFAVPNGAQLGGGNRWAQVAKLKAEGLTQGAPDLVMVRRVYAAECRNRPSGAIVGNAQLRPVAIEMKAKDGRLSPVQRDFHDVMRAEGWVVLVCFGFDDAVEQLEALGMV